MIGIGSNWNENVWLFCHESASVDYGRLEAIWGAALISANRAIGDWQYGRYHHHLIILRRSNHKIIWRRSSRTSKNQDTCEIRVYERTITMTIWFFCNFPNIEGGKQRSVQVFWCNTKTWQRQVRMKRGRAEEKLSNMFLRLAQYPQIKSLIYKLPC